MYAKMAAVLRLRALRRRADLDDRATVLLLAARCTDELCSGLLVVLGPTLRARVGLSVAQLAWCFQLLASTGALTEPAAAAAIDVRNRRPLLVTGAALWSAALLLVVAAPGFGWLLVAFALAGAAYGPLVDTADVVLVEGHPSAEERIASRATLLDTLGALVGPATVAVASGVGLDTRWLLVAVGLTTAVYVQALRRTRFPAPTRAAPSRQEAVARVADNVRAVLADREAVRWVVALLLLELLEPLEVLAPVWLHEEAGLSPAWVAVHVTAATAAGLGALVATDRWLATHDGRRLAVAAAIGVVVLQPLWLLAPTPTATLLLGAAREAAAAPLWPVLHARALASSPGRGGAVAAVVATFGAVPVHALFGWWATRVGLTAAMLGVHLAVALTLVRVIGGTGRHTRAVP